jgi:hypothetical protein
VFARFSCAASVKNYLRFAGNLTDGTIILGQSIHAHQSRPHSRGRRPGLFFFFFDGADTAGALALIWYSVRACEDGEMMTFNDLYTPLSTRKPLPWTLYLRTREAEISYSALERKT